MCKDGWRCSLWQRCTPTLFWLFLDAVFACAANYLLAVSGGCRTISVALWKLSLQYLNQSSRLYDTACCSSNLQHFCCLTAVVFAESAFGGIVYSLSIFYLPRYHGYTKRLSRKCAVLFPINISIHQTHTIKPIICHPHSSRLICSHFFLL